MRKSLENFPYWKYKGLYGEVYSNFKFSHNEYICLECGEIKKTKNWFDFEKNNIVIRNGKIINFINYYRNLYYTLLFEYPTKIALEKLKKSIMDDIDNEIYKSKEEKIRKIKCSNSRFDMK